MNEQQNPIEDASTATAEDFSEPGPIVEGGRLPGRATASMKEAQEAEFQLRVAQSRRDHIEFVQRYMGADYEPKFSDVLADQTYFVSFLRTKRTQNVAVPPISMSGQTEDLRAGRTYACSGVEARLFERILASKGIEALNMTPKLDTFGAAMNAVTQNWRHYYPSTVPPKKTGFANYKEKQEDDVE